MGHRPVPGYQGELGGPVCVVAGRAIPQERALKGAPSQRRRLFAFSSPLIFIAREDSPGAHIDLISCPWNKMHADSPCDATLVSWLGHCEAIDGLQGVGTSG